MADYYRRAREIASRVVGGEAVLVDAAENRLFVLNQAAARIWVGTDGTRSGTDLAAGLDGELVKSFLDQMVAHGLLECSPLPAGSPQPFPQSIEWPEVDQEPPWIRTSEAIEALAGVCDSVYGGGDCRVLGVCSDPFE